ncbi:MAG: hypothetical protein MJK04_24535, partial [Psychrosphaera sp.]|nr:hypothetical protein [Psychrosphaera sp.]
MSQLRTQLRAQLKSAFTVVLALICVVLSGCSDSEKAAQQADVVVVYQAGSGAPSQVDTGLR